MTIYYSDRMNTLQVRLYVRACACMPHVKEPVMNFMKCLQITNTRTCSWLNWLQKNIFLLQRRGSLHSQHHCLSVCVR